MLASTAADFGPLLFSLVAILVAAKAAGELAERIGVPSVLGEILAGIAIGPSALGLVDMHDALTGSAVTVLAELGVLLLLLQVGMEMDLAELGKVGASSMTVAVIGVAAPFGGGTIAAIALGQETKTAIFVGAALTATSVGITARVFGDLKALSTTESRVVLGAAVADDVLGLVILTVVVKIVTDGTVGVGTVASTLGLAVGFLAISGVVGILGVPRVLDGVHRFGRSAATVSVAAFAVLFLFAAFANTAKLAPIIGAFMAGLALGKSGHHERIHHDTTAIGNLLMPIFFAQIGINTELGVMGDPKVIGVALVLLVIAVIGKLISCFGLLGLRADRLLVGIGMVPRGEVGLIFASIGLANGVLDDELYASLLIVMLATTLITPPALRWRINSTAPSGAAADPNAGTIEPATGWLRVADGDIELSEPAPVSLTVPIAFRAADLARTARPGSSLLDWIAAHRTAPLEWQPADTEQLLALLREPNPRSFRFLEVSGVLERALPEVAHALERRRHDSSELDPSHLLRFPTTERLVASLDPEHRDDSVARATEHVLDTDVLLVASLVHDVCPLDDDAARSLLSRLVDEPTAELVLALGRDAEMLTAAAGDPDTFDPQLLRQIAHHLGDSGTVGGAYLLAIATGELDGWRRSALEEVLPKLLDLVRYQRGSGSELEPLVARRRQQAKALSDDQAVRDRIDAATDAYVLANDPDEIARHAQLVEPLPRKGTMRVSVRPLGEPLQWQVEVACRDDLGALARLTSSLTDHGLDILQASVATWPDGAALDVFVVSGAMRPNARDLALAFEGGSKSVVEPADLVDVATVFDNAAHPWHTMLSVSCNDAPGALQSIASAFASCGVVVVDARISSVDGRVNDRFALTDRHGRKLDASTISRLDTALQQGARRRGVRRLVRI